MSKIVEEISKVIDEKIENVLSERFARYSKHIIQERALPDVRDGLKPVQRRILYSMYKEKNLSQTPYRKSAKTVGNVIGNYHPHGDQSVYEALVRLSQDWKMREVLVDMHGNNGSIDNDPPAAMRYTEARLSKIAEELLRDIDKYTVDFVLNFDDTETEPIVLPSRFPNILVNGAQGISSGYATEIPPHNLDEVIAATIYRLRHPLCSLDEIMSIVLGPDFPTGGIVQGLDGIKAAYETGKGKIIIRCKYHFDTTKHQIIITEIPYETNKASILKKIEDIRLEKVLEGLEEARDESDKDGLRIVIDCANSANMELIINYLLKNTELKINYNFNMVVIHNKHPKQLGILPILDAYIEHQKEVIINRSNYELAKARKRLHIIEGLIKMISILDQVIYCIRHSQNKANAKENLINQFDFSQEQAEAIVTLQLYRLTATDVEVLEEEARTLTSYVAELLEILNYENVLVKVIIKELDGIRKNFGKPRLTTIQKEVEDIQIEKTQMIKSEDVLLNVTRQGFIRVVRNKTEEEIDLNTVPIKDVIICSRVVNTLDKLLIFTNKGNYILLNVHRIEAVKPQEFKQHLNDLLRIESDEHIVKVIVVKDFEQDVFIVLATAKGLIKRTQLNEFETTRNNKVYTAIAFKLDDDELVNAYLSDDCDRDIIIVSKSGYINRYSESQVPILKLKAAGVKSINLKEGDKVVGFNYLYNDKYSLLLFTQRGNGKKINPGHIEASVRTNRGHLTLKALKKNSHLYIGSVLVAEEDKFFVLKEDNFIIMENKQRETQEAIGNGKLFEPLKASDTYLETLELVSSKTNIFSPKQKKLKKAEVKIKNTVQLELFEEEVLK